MPTRCTCVLCSLKLRSSPFPRTLYLKECVPIFLIIFYFSFLYVIVTFEKSLTGPPHQYVLRACARVCGNVVLYLQSLEQTFKNSRSFINMCQNKCISPHL